MNRPFLAAVAGMAFLGTTVGAYVVASPGGEEEVVQVVETATPTPEPSATATPVLEEPSPMPSPSEAADDIFVPEGGVTYADEVTGVRFSYPKDWVIDPDDGTKGRTRIASWDIANWQTSEYPPGGVLIDIVRIPPDHAGPRPADATDTTLGGARAWERVSPPGPDGAPWARQHIVVADLDDGSYMVLAYFEDPNSDETVLLEVLESFRYSD